MLLFFSTIYSIIVVWIFCEKVASCYRYFKNNKEVPIPWKQLLLPVLPAESAKPPPISSKEFDCVAIVSRNTDGKLNTVANQIHTTTNCECIPFTGDVSDFAFVEECVRSLAASGHPVDTLVNNAGISLVGLFQDMTPDEFDRILRINVTSVYNTCHAVIPDMVRNQYGRILNISSVWGLVGASCEVAYSATKGAIKQPDRWHLQGTCPKPYRGQCDCFRCRGHDHERSSVCRREEDALRGNPGRKNGGSRRSRVCISHILAMPDYMTGEILKFDGGWI